MTFENVIDMAVWTEDRKIKILALKLSSMAAESLDDYRQTKPKELQSYKRFHGRETRQTYEKEFRSCIRLAGEPIMDYAFRVKKLAKQAYSLSKQQNNPDVIKIHDQMLSDKFLNGLPIKLGKRIKLKTYKNLEELIQATILFENALQDGEDEKEDIDIIAQIAFSEKDRETDELIESIKALKTELLESNNQVAAISKEIAKHKAEQTLQTQPTNNFARPFKPRPKFPSQRENPQFYNQYQPQQFQQHFIDNQYQFQPTNLSGQNISRSNTIQCHKCGQKGHSTRDCQLTQPFRCYCCNEQGHIARCCPFNTPTQNYNTQLKNPQYRQRK